MRAAKVHGPARHKATVTQTAGSRPDTPASASSHGSSPAARRDPAGHSHVSPVPLGHRAAPPLHPSLQAMVDTARAALLPEASAQAVVAFEPPQPDYTALARERLAESLGPAIDYTEVKCVVRSTAAAAQAAAVAFKRSSAAAALPAPTDMLTSWHSVEAMEDLSVFAAACAHEVALRAAQIQSDVMEGAPAELCASWKSTNATGRSGALSAAKALQRLSARQAAGKRRPGMPAEAEDEAGGELPPKRGSAAAAAAENEARAVQVRKRSRSAGARTRKSPQEPVVARAPLRDGSNTRAGALSARAQAAFDRAVERRRGRPADVAFGRRVSGAPGGEDGAARPRHTASGRPASATHGSTPPPATRSAAPAGTPADHASEGEAVPGRPHATGTQQRQSPSDRRPHAHGGDAAVHAYSHMRPHVPAHVDHMMEGGSWPVHAHSHVRGPLPLSPGDWGATGGGVRRGQGGAGSPPWPAPGGAGAGTGAPAVEPVQGSTTTDAALVALLQGLTEVVRQGASPAQAHVAPARPSPPASGAGEHLHAPCDDSDTRDSGQTQARQEYAGTALRQAGEEAGAVAVAAGKGARGERVRHTAGSVAAVPTHGGGRGQFGSLVEEAARAAPLPQAPQREFLSVVDLQHPPGDAARSQHAVEGGPEQHRAAEFVALEQLLHSGHRVPGSDFPFPPDLASASWGAAAPAVHNAMQDLCAAGVRQAIEAGALRGASAAASSLGSSPLQPDLEPTAAQLAVPLAACPEDGAANCGDASRGVADGSGLDAPFADCYISGLVGHGRSPVEQSGDAMGSRSNLAALDVRDSVAVDILHAALEARVKLLSGAGEPGALNSAQASEGDCGRELSCPQQGVDRGGAREGEDGAVTQASTGLRAGDALQAGQSGDGGCDEPPQAADCPHAGAGQLAGTGGRSEGMQRCGTEDASKAAEDGCAGSILDMPDQSNSGRQSFDGTGPPAYHAVVSVRRALEMVTAALSAGMCTQVATGHACEDGGESSAVPPTPAAAAAEVVVGVPVVTGLQQAFAPAVSPMTGIQQAMGQSSGAAGASDEPLSSNTLPAWRRPANLEERIRERYRGMHRPANALLLCMSVPQALAVS